MALSQGLGRFVPVVPETGAGERLPSSTEAELEARNTLRLVKDDLDDVEDDLSEDDGPKPRYLRGEFGANLVDPRDVDDPIDESTRKRIAGDLLRGIESDKQSRKPWEELAERAIEFLGLIYEEASGDVSSEGSISKVWSTLMLEAALGFWANAYAEFLPADGPVKVRDDKPAAAGIGHNGGPSLNGDMHQGSAGSDDENNDIDSVAVDRTVLAEAFEHDFNHYLLVGDKQYYRDFSRMLWSLGPKGTEFRKVYYNPLRKLSVSEWVKSDNLIVSNEAADISTAQRVTERMPNFLQADVKRLQWMGWWLDIPLAQPRAEPTKLEKKAHEVEGINPQIDIPADHPHEFYECYTQRDLEGFEHTEDGRETGLPLPYRFTIEKDSRDIVEIRRNWKEDDEDFRARQRYVMFGLVPGFGLYYLGFSHLLGNTERGATALTREVIDSAMVSIFPGWLAAKGSLLRGTTQLKVGPMGVVEVDVANMGRPLSDSFVPIPSKPVDQNVLALLEKLERNGRNVSGKLELPQGEGTQNIPVGTMIAIVEQGTKVMMAVHKGLHASRAEELELLRELIAEDPSVLTRNAKSPKRNAWEAEEFRDLDLVPSSDPNTPSHVHRLMRGIGMAQLQQMFPGLINSRHVLEALLNILQVQNPDYYVLTPEEQAANAQQAPDQVTPQMIAAKAKIGVAQIQAQMKARDTEQAAMQSREENAAKERVAMIDRQTELEKSHAQVEQSLIQSHLDHQHEMGMQQREHAHAAQQGAQDRQHEAMQGQQDRMLQAHQSAQDRAHQASEGAEDRKTEKETASLSSPTPKRQF